MTKVLWGIAPKAPIHYGIATHLKNLKSYQESGAELIIVFSDILDDKSYVDLKVKYFQDFFEQIGGLSFTSCIASVMEKQIEYQEALKEVLFTTSLNKLKKSVHVSLQEQPQYSAYLNVLQNLDVVYTQANIVYGDYGQKKIYQLFSAIKKELCINREVDFHFKDLPLDLKGQKLSLSSSRTRINIHEDSEAINKKLVDLVVNQNTDLNMILNYSSQLFDFNFCEKLKARLRYFTNKDHGTCQDKVLSSLSVLLGEINQNILSKLERRNYIWVR